MVAVSLSGSVVTLSGVLSGADRADSVRVRVTASDPAGAAAISSFGVQFPPLTELNNPSVDCTDGLPIHLHHYGAPLPQWMHELLDDAACKWSRTLAPSSIPDPVIVTDSAEYWDRLFTPADTFPAGLNLFVYGNRINWPEGYMAAAVKHPYYRVLEGGEYGWVFIGGASDLWTATSSDWNTAWVSNGLIHEIGHVVGLVPGTGAEGAEGAVSDPAALEAFRAMGGANYPRAAIPTQGRVHWDKCSGLHDSMGTTTPDLVSITPVSLAVMRKPWAHDPAAPPIVPYLPGGYGTRQWEMIDRMDSTSWNHAEWGCVDGITVR